MSSGIDATRRAYAVRFSHSPVHTEPVHAPDPCNQQTPGKPEQHQYRHCPGEIPQTGAISTPVSRQRRQFLAGLVAPLLFPEWLMASNTSVTRLTTAPAAWRGRVSEAAWKVLFEEATEPPGSSPLNQEKRDGTYVCAACFLPLFESADKFDSGTGWPSFTRAIEGHTDTRRDYKLLWPRTEYHCARCGGHQGHVFNDGPAPAGQRWCNNGLALRFVPAEETLPALRS